MKLKFFSSALLFCTCLTPGLAKADSISPQRTIGSYTLSIGYTIEKWVNGKVVETASRPVGADNNITIDVKGDDCAGDFNSSCYGEWKESAKISGYEVSFDVGISSNSKGQTLVLLVDDPEGESSSVNPLKVDGGQSLGTSWLDASGAKYDLILQVDPAIQ